MKRIEARFLSWELSAMSLSLNPIPYTLLLSFLSILTNSFFFLHKCLVAVVYIQKHIRITASPAKDISRPVWLHKAKRCNYHAILLL